MTECNQCGKQTDHHLDQICVKCSTDNELCSRCGQGDWHGGLTLCHNCGSADMWCADGNCEVPIDPAKGLKYCDRHAS